MLIALRGAYGFAAARTMLSTWFYNRACVNIKIASPKARKDGRKRNWVSCTFARVVEELGLNEGITHPLDKVYFHTPRRTFGSWLAQNGTPIYTIAQLMGHKDLSMTQRYAHLVPDTMRAAAFSLSGALERKPAKVLPFSEASGIQSADG